MASWQTDLNTLTVRENLFKGLKFFVSGQVPHQIIELLKNGGGERLNYFLDYCTHLICGENPDDTDIGDANDIYEIPAVTPKWIVMCCKIGKIVSTKPYMYNPRQLFSNMVFTTSKLGKDLQAIWAIISYHGGVVQLNFDSRCTHLITVDVSSQKYEKATTLGADKVAIVTPDWILESVHAKTLMQIDLYHPRLIQWPKVVKHESTTAITGFEPEKSDTNQPATDNVADSTQALLEKLKSRMPWNQPTTSSVIPNAMTTAVVSTVETVAPPNVVAPSYMNKQVQAQAQPPQVVRSFPQAQQIFPQQQQQSQGQSGNMVPNQIPRSIVHHTAQPLQQQQMMQTQPQSQSSLGLNPNQMRLNRLIGQQPPQPRANIQQLRGQLGPNQQQLHQQLLQQRIAQQSPQNNQRINIQQQLLQQQLAQQQQQQQAQQNQLGPVRQLISNQTQMLNPPQFQQPQHLVQQQNKVFSQQQAVAQPNLIQNQPNLAVQQQFLGPNQQFPQQQVQQTQHFVQQQQAASPSEIAGQQLHPPPQFVQQQQQQQQQQPQPQMLNQSGQFGQPQVSQQPPQPRPPQLWQQQPQQQPQQQGQPPPRQQMTVRHPVNIVQQQGPRLQWAPNQQQQQPNQMPQRQFIQLDAHTHNELQKMPPDQQALFIARLQKHKQLFMQKQLQQRGGGGQIFIRGSVPHGLNAQQQLQWLQEQAKQQGVVLPPNIQQQANLVQQQPQSQHAPGLSPIQQNSQFAVAGGGNNNEQQIRQYRLQQLHLQRDQVQKNLQQQQQQVVGVMQPQNVVRPNLVGPVVADSTTQPATNQPIVDGNNVAGQHQLVVNPKTKTALANMLSSRLQSGTTVVGPVAPDALPQEPSAAGTLRLMTAQHNAALNPNNRPQDLLAMQQRRVINGPNGEIIRPPQPQGVPVPPHSEPPKLQFSPRPIVPLQHRPGPFYGHNPNLKLPPDLFLLGCIFVVVEIERYLDESLTGWQQKIERHGGEIEKQYCSRVTHVLCETQRHGVVMQAIRDFKRCITIYWLSDVMKRKQVLPPWTALHLPAIYLDTTPASKHLIAQTGFVGDERQRVKHMINYTGAKLTTYFTKHNTLLIAAKAEGLKYAHAKKWATPVVNVQWLTDVMLGNFSALNQTEHIMYQQFQGQPNFSFDPKLVPNLMHGWKMPINISQESYERVKRSASPVVMPKKAKKMKLEPTDENDNFHNDLETNPHYRILFSSSTDVDNLKKIVRQLGGALAKSHEDCTHLVMGTLGRTNKLLFCVCRDVRIMPEQWLRDSMSAQKFLDCASYSLDFKDFNSDFKCDFGLTLATKNRHRLFEGKFFWITPSVFPSRKVLTELVQSCGGMVEKIRRTAAQIEATNINSPYSYIIITHENDIHLVGDLLKNKKGKIRIVCSAELIFSAILKQTFDVEPFAVKVL